MKHYLNIEICVSRKQEHKKKISFQMYNQKLCKKSFKILQLKFVKVWVYDLLYHLQKMTFVLMNLVVLPFLNIHDRLVQFVSSSNQQNLVISAFTK